VVTVERGPSYARIRDDHYQLSLGVPGQFQELVQDLERTTGCRLRSATSGLRRLWSCASRGRRKRTGCIFDLCFFAPMHIGRAIGEIETKDIVEFTFVTKGTCEVIGGDLVLPLASTIFGPCRVLPLEYKNLFCRHIDLECNDTAQGASDQLISDLLYEFASTSKHRTVAYRRGRRWIPGACTRAARNIARADTSVPAERCVSDHWRSWSPRAKNRHGAIRKVRSEANPDRRSALPAPRPLGAHYRGEVAVRTRTSWCHTCAAATGSGDYDSRGRRCPIRSE